MRMAGACVLSPTATGGRRVACHDKRHVATSYTSVIVSTTLETMRDRGAGLNVVWREFAVLFGVGTGLVRYALVRFRTTIGMMV